MSDNELLKLTYEAYGFRLHSMSSKVLYHADYGTSMKLDDWNPLRDDAQAMWLVERLRLNICTPYKQDANPGWEVFNDGVEGVGGTEGQVIVVNAFLNRAIVECAAKLQLQSSISKQRQSGDEEAND